jgi:hypothetical protein
MLQRPGREIGGSSGPVDRAGPPLRADAGLGGSGPGREFPPSTAGRTPARARVASSGNTSTSPGAPPGKRTVERIRRRRAPRAAPAPSPAATGGTRVQQTVVRGRAAPALPPGAQRAG